MRPVFFPLDTFSLFFTSAKSNDIRNILIKSVFVQKMAYTYIYDISMSPEHFEIKNKNLRPL